MTERTIRAATAADIPAITAIYGHSVRTETASFEFDPPAEAEMARRMSAFHAAGFPYLVCERRSDGRILGYAYASHWRPRIGYNHTVEDSLYIA
ncbi:MAG: N-acetyltransferase, partial [Rhizobiales bacterium]|nr:N-acetyltransferase [Hyphomicrobiales bacterium]